MPKMPKRPCAAPRCPALVEAGERYCPEHKRESYRQDQKLRGTAHERGYTKRWARARRRYLNASPLCIECARQGMTTAADVVDHIIPHKGNYDLFWNEDNWQPLCKRHHDIKTATEDGGFGQGRGE